MTPAPRLRLLAVCVAACLVPLAHAGTLAAGPMVGYTDMHNTRIWVQSTQPARATVEYWPARAATAEAGVHKTVQLDLTPDTDASGILAIGQLLPGTRYAYQIRLDGEPAGPVLEFATQPRWQYRDGVQPPDFTALLGSCAYVNEPDRDRSGTPYGNDYGIFQAMADKKPDLTLWLGDNTYLRENDYTHPQGIRHRYRHDRALPQLQPLLQTGQHAAIWDDHDYGPNDANSSYVFKDESLKVFRQYWANASYGLPDAPGVFGNFSFSDVDFFLLDDRWYRDSHLDVDTADKAQFGARQMRWLRNALLNSTATFKVIAGGGQFLNDLNPYEGWNHYPQERRDFLNWLERNRVPGVLFLSGDRHHTELVRLPRDKAYPLYDLTCSPLTAGTHPVAREADKPALVPGTLVGERNFCSLAVRGPREARVLTLKSWDARGKELWSRDIPAGELRGPARSR